jgi:hypothetical protein
VSVGISKEIVDIVGGLTDPQCAQIILLGLARLIRTNATPEQIMVFVTDTVNTIRRGEAGKIHVRDEGAN